MPREQQSNSRDYVRPAVDPVSEANDSDAIWFEEDDDYGRENMRGRANPAEAGGAVPEDPGLEG